jgi:hypothetical protein
LDDNRVNDISNYQLNFFKKYNTFCFIGDLSLVKLDEHFIIIDGFHRFSAMKKIYLQKPSYIITLNIITPSSELTIEQIFILINKCEPIPEYIMKTTLDIKGRHIINEFSKKFTIEYKIYISKSKTPRRPNILLDVLLSQLLESKVFMVFSSGNELFNYIKYININKWKDMDSKNSIVCLDKALKYNKSALFITNDIDNKWINNNDWINEFINSQSIKRKSDDIIENMNIIKRKSFPKIIRLQIWTKYFKENSMQAKCMCCNGDINYNTFECGHIISVKNNGTSTLENLIPICMTCNRSCGSENMVDFCKRYNLPLKIIF